MFSLVLFGGTRLAMSAVSDARWPVGSQQGSGECPPSASLLWSSGCQAAVPQRSTSSWAPLDPPSAQLLQDMANHGSPPLTASPTWDGVGGPPPLDPAVVPAPSPISQFFDTKITLAGRCYSHISGIFASVLLIFFKDRLTLFFSFQCVILLFLSTCSGLQITGC